ncbi:MAG: CBS domain-containing protein [Albidovulum sp.]|nr:CBS domain-containing protein [Albidovulum sp.]MDE0532904.1 CBS domain-containing protein [Albidovulum sp.]
MLVKQILQSKADQSVATIRPDLSISEAISILSKKRIGALVVSETGKDAAGVISERDIVREIGIRGTGLLNDSVKTIMSSNVICCAEEETADQVLTKMTNGRFRHMPVLCNGEMIGLISIGDVVKARLSELDMEKQALEGMIMGH